MAKRFFASLGRLQLFNHHKPFRLKQAFSTSNSSTVDRVDHTRPQRFFPRRAVMYVPASDEHKTKKASSLKVDTIVFDIEDGIAANQKV